MYLNFSVVNNWTQKDNQEKAHIETVHVTGDPFFPTPSVKVSLVLFSAVSPVPRTTAGKTMHLCPHEICWANVFRWKKIMKIEVLLIWVWVLRPWGWSAFSGGPLSNNWSFFHRSLCSWCWPVRHSGWIVGLLPFFTYILTWTGKSNHRMLSFITQAVLDSSMFVSS